MLKYSEAIQHQAKISVIIHRHSNVFTLKLVGENGNSIWQQCLWLFSGLLSKALGLRLKWVTVERMCLFQLVQLNMAVTLEVVLVLLFIM